MPGNGLQTAARARLILLRREAWDSFYVFAKFVCGNNLMEEQPHREVCQFLTAGVDTSSILSLGCEPELTVPSVVASKKLLKKLLMLPRGSFKSTIASQAFVLWLLWHNPSLRIMLDCETLSNAKFYLAGIKNMIENSPMLKMICVNEDEEYVLEPHKSIAGGFTEDQVILKHRTRLGLKEPTIFCSGVDNARTGMHPDVIIMDDLVSERNVATQAQIEKVKDHYRFSLSLLEPGGLQVVIGTRYNMADLYGDLLESGAFDVMVRPAIDKDGQLFFPSRLTQAFLDAQRREQGSYIFSSQYLLTPIDDSNAIFKREHIQYYDKPPDIVSKYILIDLAISQKETADYTVIMCVGQDASKKFYVIEYIQRRMLPHETIKEIFSMYNRHKESVKIVGIETVAFQKSMLYFIQDEMRRTGTYMPLKELKADMDKIRRIGALQPMFENGDIYIKRTHKELEQELLEFPYSKHDDIVDALAYIQQVLRPGVNRSKPLEYKYPTGNRFVNY